MDHNNNFRDLEHTVEMVEHPTEQQIDRMYSALGITRSGLTRDVAHLRGWLRKQPHLPADEIDDLELERMLVRCKNSLVVAQRRLDSSYSVRSVLPEFYASRDPLAPDVQQVNRLLGMFPLPQLTSDCRRVHMVRLLDPDVSKFDVEHVVKTMFMCMDVVLREPPTQGDVLIWDAEGYTLAHALSVSPGLVRKGIYCATHTYPARVSAVHILNPPPFADKVVNLIKQFLPEKMANRIHLHTSIDSLYEHVPRDIMPCEYGGKEWSVNALQSMWVKKLESYRSWFLHSEKVRTNESLRIGKNSTQSNLSGIDGSFRKLEID